MAFIQAELETNPGTPLFIINGFDYDFREGDIISFSDVGSAYQDYKVESVKIRIDRVDAADPGGQGSQVWGAAFVLLVLSVVP